MPKDANFIIGHITAVTSITVDDMLSGEATPEMLRARDLAWDIMHTTGDFSLADICILFRCAGRSDSVRLGIVRSHNRLTLDRRYAKTRARILHVYKSIHSLHAST